MGIITIPIELQTTLKEQNFLAHDSELGDCDRHKNLDIFKDKN